MTETEPTLQSPTMQPSPKPTMKCFGADDGGWASLYYAVRDYMSQD